MPTYQELRTTYSQLTAEELCDLALRPAELTAEAHSALADELSSRGVPIEAAAPISGTSASDRTPSWFSGWLTVFQAWITANIILAIGLLRPGLGWSTLFMLAAVAVPVGGLVLIAKRDPMARRFWRAFLAIVLVAQAVAVVTAGVFRQFSGKSLVQIAITLAWYMYWRRSRRVATEFGDASGPASPGDA